jgi:hypothetical protein
MVEDSSKNNLVRVMLLFRDQRDKLIEWIQLEVKHAIVPVGAVSFE